MFILPDLNVAISIGILYPD